MPNKVNKLIKYKWVIFWDCLAYCNAYPRELEVNVVCIGWSGFRGGLLGERYKLDRVRRDGWDASHHSYSI